MHHPHPLPHPCEMGQVLAGRCPGDMSFWIELDEGIITPAQDTLGPKKRQQINYSEYFRIYNGIKWVFVRRINLSSGLKSMSILRTNKLTDPKPLQNPT
jgi:hypothetical protein